MRKGRNALEKYYVVIRGVPIFISFVYTTDLIHFLTVYETDHSGPPIKNIVYRHPGLFFMPFHRSIIFTQVKRQEEKRNQRCKEVRQTRLWEDTTHKHSSGFESD